MQWLCCLRCPHILLFQAERIIRQYLEFCSAHELGLRRSRLDLYMCVLAFSLALDPEVIPSELKTQQEIRGWVLGGKAK